MLLSTLFGDMAAKKVNDSNVFFQASVCTRKKSTVSPNMLSSLGFKQRKLEAVTREMRR